MKCPVCGQTAYIKYHQIEPSRDGRQLQSCSQCAIEARQQINATAAAEIVGPSSRTRAEAVTAALS